MLTFPPNPPKLPPAADHSRIGRIAAFAILTMIGSTFAVTLLTILLTVR